MVRYAVLGCGFALAASAAQAELQRLTAQQMRTELFGTHQFGHEQNSGLLVDECIELSGRTVYRTREDERAAPYSEPGQMWVTEEALSCFAYPDNEDPGPHCFQVFRDGDGYVFQSVDGAARFIISNVKRGVKECPPSGVFLS